MCSFCALFSQFASHQDLAGHCQNVYTFEEDFLSNLFVSNEVEMAMIATIKGRVMAFHVTMEGDAEVLFYFGFVDIFPLNYYYFSAVRRLLCE